MRGRRRGRNLGEGHSKERKAKRSNLGEGHSKEYEHMGMNEHGELVVNMKRYLS